MTCENGLSFQIMLNLECYAFLELERPGLIYHLNSEAAAIPQLNTLLRYPPQLFGTSCLRSFPRVSAPGFAHRCSAFSWHAFLTADGNSSAVWP
jgi:hypothetical protein